MNLVVGDYFKHGCALLEYTDMAEDLITWIRSKTMLLDLIQEEQLKQNRALTTIIWPVLTRWTAHLRAYQRILQTENVLVAVVATEMGKAEGDQLFITGDWRAKKKAHRMVDTIWSSSFWSNLHQ